MEPIHIYAKMNVLLRATVESTQPVTQYIEEKRRWARERQAHGAAQGTLPQSRSSKLAERAKEMAEEWTQYQEYLQSTNTRRRQQGRQAGSRRENQDGSREQGRRWKRAGNQAVRKMVELEWKREWQKAARGKRAPAWRQAWTASPFALHENLTKAQSTMATLLLTEVIGLNDWLTWAKVPGKRPECDCGWNRQPPKHVVTMCPNLQGREDMWTRAGTTNYERLLDTPKGLHTVTEWLINQGVLDQFKVAAEMARDGPQVLRPLQEGMSPVAQHRKQW